MVQSDAPNVSTTGKPKNSTYITCTMDFDHCAFFGGQNRQMNSQKVF